MNTFDTHAFESNMIEPEEVARPDVVGVFAMPINAHMGNTGDRIHMLAELTGMKILTVDFYNQDRRMSHGMKARDANVPSGDVFDLVSQYRVDFVQDQLSDLKHDLTIGIGDSLGVPAIEGMALADHDLFDVISLRDGWNLREKESAITGIARYLGYQVSDAINSRLHPRNFNIPPSAYADVPLSQPSEVSGLGKIWNVAPAMIGYEAQESAIELAGKIAMQVKLFDHGLSGTIDQARAFQKQLDKARTNGTAPLRVDIVPGWHDHLMDPARGAHDVMNALKLLSK